MKRISRKVLCIFLAVFILLSSTVAQASEMQEIIIECIPTHDNTEMTMTSTADNPQFVILSEADEESSNFYEFGTIVPEITCSLDSGVNSGNPPVYGLEIHAPSSISLEAGTRTSFDVTFSGIGIDSLDIELSGSGISSGFESVSWNSSPCRATIWVSASENSTDGILSFILKNNTLGSIKSQNVAIIVIKHQPEVRDLKINAPSKVSLTTGNKTTFDVTFSGIGINSLDLSTAGNGISAGFKNVSWASNPCRAKIWVSASEDGMGTVTFKLMNDVFGNIKSQNIVIKATTKQTAPDEKLTPFTPTERYYSFLSKGNTSLAMTVSGGKDSNGTPIILKKSSNGNISQLIEPIELSSDGGVRLIPGSTGIKRNLDIQNGNLAPKAKVQLYDWNKSAAQKFVLAKDAKGYVVIKLKENPNLVLTAMGNIEGCEIRLDTYTGSDMQKWKMVNYAENPKPVSRDVNVYTTCNGKEKIGVIPAGRDVWPHSHSWSGRIYVVGVTTDNVEVAGWITQGAFNQTAKTKSSLPKGIVVTQAGSRTCTLAASVMMLRAKTYLTGMDYSSITEANVKPYAWSDGLRYSFTYDGWRVEHKYINDESLSSKKQILIDELHSHPEGVVIWDDRKPHAVHLISYDNGIFYVNDPANGSYNQPLSKCNTICGSGQDGKLAHIYKLWHITN